MEAKKNQCRNSRRPQLSQHWYSNITYSWAQKPQNNAINWKLSGCNLMCLKILSLLNATIDNIIMM